MIAFQQKIYISTFQYVQERQRLQLVNKLQLVGNQYESQVQLVSSLSLFHTNNCFFLVSAQINYTYQISIRNKSVLYLYQQQKKIIIYLLKLFLSRHLFIYFFKSYSLAKKFSYSVEFFIRHFVDEITSINISYTISI